MTFIRMSSKISESQTRSEWHPRWRKVGNRVGGSEKMPGGEFVHLLLIAALIFCRCKSNKTTFLSVIINSNKNSSGKFRFIY